MDVCAIIEAEADDFGALSLSPCAQSLKMRTVAFDDGRATADQTFEYLSFGVSNRFDGAEVFEMHRFDRRDDGCVRKHHFRQCPDFSSVVHADFENCVLSIARHPGKRERHAPVIIVRFLRSVDAAGSNSQETSTQHFLCAGLASAAGYSNHTCLWC